MLKDLQLNFTDKPDDLTHDEWEAIKLAIQREVRRRLSGMLTDEDEWSVCRLPDGSLYLPYGERVDA